MTNVYGNFPANYFTKKYFFFLKSRRLIHTVKVALLGLVITLKLILRCVSRCYIFADTCTVTCFYISIY